MLSFSGLPRSFWVEIVLTVCYLINKSSFSIIGFKTPMEIWSSHPTNYENLRIFGYVAYAHVKQGKLNPGAKKCIFLGYPEWVKSTSYGVLRRVIKR